MSELEFGDDSGNTILSINHENSISHEIGDIIYEFVTPRHAFEASKVKSNAEAVEAISQTETIQEAIELVAGKYKSSFNPEVWKKELSQDLLAIVLDLTEQWGEIKNLIVTSAKSFVYVNDDPILGTGDGSGMNLWGKMLSFYRDNHASFEESYYPSSGEDTFWESSWNEDFSAESFTGLKEIEANKDAPRRFIVGMIETHKKRPGKNPGEKAVPREKWDELKSIWMWRSILSDDYVTTRKYGPMQFEIDGVVWPSVTHYLYGMMYANSPEYSLLYSMEAAEKGVGFWGSVSSARKEHARNIVNMDYLTDESYSDKSGQYLLHAYMAKFSQNPLARKTLLATRNAVISRRDGVNGIMDIPAYAAVREWIQKNPKKTWHGEGVIKEIVEDIPTIVSISEINKGGPFISVRSDEFAHREKVLVSPCYVYVATGVRNFDIETISEQFGDPIRVRRHVYALELIAHNAEHGIGVFVQRTATSVVSEYLVFHIVLDYTMAIHLEKFESGWSVFIVSDVKDDRVLDFLRKSINVTIDD